MNHFSTGLWHVMKSGFHTTGDGQLSGWTEKELQSTSQSHIWPRKGHGHCLVVRCPSDPLQLSELQWNDHTWEVCSANQKDALKTPTPAANTGHQRGPSSLPRQRATARDTANQRTGLWGSASSTVLTWPLSPIGYLFANHRNNCLQGKRFHKQQKQKMLSRKSLNSKAWIFFARTRHLFFFGKKCVDCNGSYFD